MLRMLLEARMSALYFNLRNVRGLWEGEEARMTFTRMGDLARIFESRSHRVRWCLPNPPSTSSPRHSSCCLQYIIMTNLQVGGQIGRLSSESAVGKVGSEGDDRLGRLALG